QLAMVSSLDELAGLLSQLDQDAPYPGAAAEGSRGRTTRPKRPPLPAGWLDSRGVDPSGKSLLSEADPDISGGCECPATLTRARRCGRAPWRSIRHGTKSGG